MMRFTNEIIEKVKTAKSAEELLAMAKAENIELSAEQAAQAFVQLNKNGKLSDEELDNVTGGCGYQSGEKPKFAAGDRVYWYECGEKRYGIITEVFPKSPHFGNQFPYGIFTDKGGMTAIAEEHLPNV